MNRRCCGFEESLRNNPSDNYFWENGTKLVFIGGMGRASSGVQIISYLGVGLGEILRYFPSVFCVLPSFIALWAWKRRRRPAAGENPKKKTLIFSLWGSQIM